MDEKGYLNVMSLIDDVINVAGHRISANGIRESILSNGTVGDCGEVGKEESLKSVNLAICVLKRCIDATKEHVLQEIVKHVRQGIDLLLF